jgi:predicted nucleic acid-binding protein
VILVDSNVLIDVSLRDPMWSDWSSGALSDACETESIAVNQIVVAEVSPTFSSLEAFVDWLSPLRPKYVDITNEAAFLGGKAFVRHRRQRKSGKEKSKSILADFLIGGHAQTLGATILTRDPRFYRTYFPSVPLITPEKAKE